MQLRLLFRALDLLSKGCLYPLQTDVLAVELRAAKNIFDQNLAGISRAKNIQELIEKNVYHPDYTSLA